MNEQTKLDRELKQWVIWPPAMALMLALVLGLYLFGTAALPRWSVWLYAAVMLGVMWWLLPRFAFKLWREGDALCWQWGQLHQGPLQRVALVDIAAVEVGELPDKPTRPMRKLGQAELHGGNFTPALNRGVKLSLRDGRMLWFGLPQPDKFAAALQKACAATISAP